MDPNNSGHCRESMAKEKSEYDTSKPPRWVLILEILREISYPPQKGRKNTMNTVAQKRLFDSLSPEEQEEYTKLLADLGEAILQTELHFEDFEKLGRGDPNESRFKQASRLAQESVILQNDIMQDLRNRARKALRGRPTAT